MFEYKTDLIIIAGHSHTRALIGYGDGRQAGVYLLPVEGHDRIFGLHSPWPRPKEYWSTLIRYGSGNTIALLWEGNLHNELFLIEPVPRFDFVLRQFRSLPVDEGVAIVPEALVRAKFRLFFGGLLADLLAALKAQAGCRIALVGTPPPIGDNEHLRGLLPTELPFLNRPPGAMEEQLTLTSPIVRLKLWLVVQQIFEEQAQQAGVDFVPVPDNVTDEIGFLRPEFWGVDLTHSNPAYGRVMVSCLAERFAPTPQTASLVGAFRSS